MGRPQKFVNLPEWASRITRLRKQLGYSQGELARQLECSAMSVSRWERGLMAPSAECYIQLGRLARDFDAWFFWGQAGLQAADVMQRMPEQQAAPRLVTSAELERAHAGGEGKAEEHEDAKVVIPLLATVAGSHGHHGAKRMSLYPVPATKMIRAPLGWCPNPRYTSMVRVRGSSMEPLIRDGDILAVDSFQTDREELNGKIVVAASEKKGLCVSRLRRYETLDVLESENREHSPIVLGKNSGWRILGRVLWWISAAP
jgi:phage repressor protein C with HTH and peptisase S24 domain/DNA-binding XRE family transcriptional regulator